MKYLFLLALLTSCADIQKATNVHAITDDNNYYEKLIKVVASESEVSSCKFISKVKGEDNLINSGKESAIISMKKFADGKGANTVWVEKCEEVPAAFSTVVNICTGKVYKCP